MDDPFTITRVQPGTFEINQFTGYTVTGFLFDVDIIPCGGRKIQIMYGKADQMNTAAGSPIHPSGWPIYPSVWFMKDGRIADVAEQDAIAHYFDANGGYDKMLGALQKKLKAWAEAEQEAYIGDNNEILDL